MATKLWQLTDAMTDRKIKLGGHTYWRHKTTRHWWTKDTARHANCAFKVYEMQGKKLVWIADANEYGDYIRKKHKGPTGRIVTVEIEEDEDDSFGRGVR